VLGGLYVGSIGAANNAEALRRLQVACVLSLCSEKVRTMLSLSPEKVALLASSSFLLCCSAANFFRAHWFQIVGLCLRSSRQMSTPSSAFCICLTSDLWQVEQLPSVQYRIVDNLLDHAGV
jgi:hypothetical protein